MYICIRIYIHVCNLKYWQYIYIYTYIFILQGRTGSKFSTSRQTLLLAVDDLGCGPAWRFHCPSAPIPLDDTSTNLEPQLWRLENVNHIGFAAFKLDSYSIHLQWILHDIIFIASHSCLPLVISRCNRWYLRNCNSRKESTLWCPPSLYLLAGSWQKRNTTYIYIDTRNHS